MSSLYIFVAFVLFISLCNTSFNLSTLHLVSMVGFLTSDIHHLFLLISPPLQTDRCRLCLRTLFLCKWLTGRSFISYVIIVGHKRKKKNYFHSLSRVSSLYLPIQMILVYRSYFLKATQGKSLFFFGLANLISCWLYKVCYIFAQIEKRLAAWICDMCQVWIRVCFK